MLGIWKKRQEDDFFKRIDESIYQNGDNVSDLYLRLSDALFNVGTTLHDLEKEATKNGDEAALDLLDSFYFWLSSHPYIPESCRFKKTTKETHKRR